MRPTTETLLRIRHPYLLDVMSAGTVLDCGDGWEEIVSRLLGDIESAMHTNAVDVVDWPCVYVTTSPQGEMICRLEPSVDWLGMEEIIQRAQQDALKTCIQCGSAGRRVEVHLHGRVLCAACEKAERRPEKR